MTVPATALYGALGAILHIVLSANVSRVRVKVGIFLDPKAPPPELYQAMRAQGNLVEYLPLALVLLLVMELMGAPSTFLHALGGALILVRLLHAAGVLSQKIPLRAIGSAGTFLLLIVEAVYTLVLRFQ
jgi:hypothetical protein